MLIIREEKKLRKECMIFFMQTEAFILKLLIFHIFREQKKKKFWLTRKIQDTTSEAILACGGS